MWRGGGEGGQITRKVQVGVDSSETTYEAGWIGPFHFLIRTRSPPPPPPPFIFDVGPSKIAPGVLKRRQRPPFIAYWGGGGEGQGRKKWNVQFYFQPPTFYFAPPPLLHDVQEFKQVTL